MDLSIYSWFGFFEPVSSRLSRIRDAGFNGVMLAWEDETEPVHVSIRDQVRMARERELRIVNAHAPYRGWNLLWYPDHPDRKVFLSQLNRWIEEVGESEIPSLVVHTGDIVMEEAPVLSAGIDAFSELCETAEKHGTSLAVENVSRQYLLRTIFDHVESPALRFCYDSSHDFMLPCCRGTILKDYKDKLITMHLSDNDLKEDKHWIPGEGKINYARIAKDLAESPVDHMGLEVLKSQGDPRGQSEYLQAAYQAARRIEKLIKR